MIFAVYIDIFENGYPVVRHIFYGKSLEEAEGYEQAHMKTDIFMRDAVQKGFFRDFPVRVKRFIRIFDRVPSE